MFVALLSTFELCSRLPLDLYIIYSMYSIIILCSRRVFRYAFEGVLQAIYGFDRDPLKCEPVDDAMCKILESPKKILEELDVEDAKFYMDFIWLCVFFVGLRIACYIVLWWRVKVH